MVNFQLHLQGKVRKSFYAIKYVADSFVNYIMDFPYKIKERDRHENKLRIMENWENQESAVASMDAGDC